MIVAALGESAEMSGESSSRSNITIPQVQKDLLKALLKTGKPIVLVLFTGRPLVLTEEFIGPSELRGGGPRRGHLQSDPVSINSNSTTLNPTSRSTPLLSWSVTLPA